MAQQNTNTGAGEMAQWLLRALVTLAQDLRLDSQHPHGGNSSSSTGVLSDPTEH